MQPNHLFFEALEDRQLLSTPWGAQARLIGQDLAAQRFPGINGSGYSIAIIDSGVDYNHPSLGGGWGKKVIAGWDFDRNDSDPMSDTYAHGTGVAGMAAADPYDYKGYHYQGIAPNAKLIALRQHGSGGVASALKWVLANKSKYNIVAVNITDYAGGGNTDIWRSIASSIDQLDGMGVYITEPSGNSGSRSFGNTDPNQHEVGSVTLSDGISGFTNRGPGLDFLAPGDNVTVTYYDVGSHRHIYVDSGDGTSWSSPQIAGAATLIKQINPGFNSGQITSILKDSAVWKYDSATSRSYPRLNLYNALVLAYQRAGKSLPPVVQPPDTSTPQQPGGVVVSTPTNIGTSTTIQVEDFDAGASGTAYWDSTSGNQGGNNYRGTNVDIISLNDSGSTRGVGMVKAGEWLKYTVNVASAGTYNVEFRTAALGAGGQFRLEVDGKDVTGALNVPDTRSWTSYTTVTKSGVALGSGKHTLRLYFVRNGKTGYVGNFNQMRFTKTTTPVSPTPPASTVWNLTPGIGTTIQAEDFTGSYDKDSAHLGGGYRTTSVDIEKTLDTGGGYDIGYMQAGEWLSYAVNTVTAGTFNLDLRIASPATGAKFHVEIDGNNVTGSVGFTNTGGFQNWTTLRRSGIAMSAGKHTVKLVVESTGNQKYAGNVNWIKFS
jgi:Subtilase family/Carbohydrate binding module (family 6)